MNVKNHILQRDAEEFFKAEAELRLGYTTLTPAQIADALAVYHRQIIVARPTGEQYRELAAQFAEVLAQQTRAALPAALNNGVIVRAACLAGLLPGLSVESVGDMSPGTVLKLAGDVSAAISAAFALPGE
jgi:uncharacterized protein (DUF433 family)